MSAVKKSASTENTTSRKQGRPVVITYDRTKSHYWIPMVTKEKMSRIADKLGLTMTDTFIALVAEEYNKRRLESEE